MIVIMLTMTVSSDQDLDINPKPGNKVVIRKKVRHISQSRDSVRMNDSPRSADSIDPFKILIS